MIHEMALKLAQTETPEQMADRIVELYETIETLEAERNDLRTNAERWERAWQLAVEERDSLQIQLDDLRTNAERECAWKRTGPFGYYMGPIYQWVAGCCNRSEHDRPRHDWCPWCGGRIRIEERQ